MEAGLPKEKLVVGISTVGRTFTLADPEEFNVGALSTGPGDRGFFSPEVGIMPYNEICHTSSSWTFFWETDQKVPYALKGDQWVGFDDIHSVAIKLNYILANDLGGAMFWSLETDDFSKLIN